MPAANFEAAKLTFNSGGLGVCNNREAACGSAQAPVTDTGPQDWLLFTAVDGADLKFLTARLSLIPLTAPPQPQSKPFNLTYWVGYADTVDPWFTAFSPGSVSGTFVSKYGDGTSQTYNSSGSGADFQVTDTGYYKTLNVRDTGSERSNFLLLGARRGGIDDAFYLNSVTLDSVAVPAPGSILLLISGLVMLGANRLRRIR